MSIVSSVMQKYDRTIKSCTLNTGTIFDLATGNFFPGKDGRMILNGGLCISNAVTGRQQTYKSSVSLGLFIRALNNYTDSEGIAYETEMTLKGKQRIVELLGKNPINNNLHDRFEFYDKTELSIEDLFEVIKNVAKEKFKNKKNLIRETPFVDDQGNYIRSWVPTVIAIDSFSAATSNKEISLYDEHNIGDSKTNMVNMNDGRIKTEFCRQMPQLCGAHGIYLISTAHIGDNRNLENPHAGPTRELPSMRAADKLKNVGSQYSFLAVNMIETRKTEALQDSNKKCFFPSETCASDVELQAITTYVTRCKNNVSSDSYRHISSQFEGIQEYLEYYTLIKDCKNTSILEGRDAQKIGIYDIEFNRHNIRAKLAADPQFRRAIEILGHFVFVRNRWNNPRIRAIGYAEFCKKFNESKTLKDEILNSTSIWSFNDTPSALSYMSILDIIERIGL